MNLEFVAQKIDLARYPFDVFGELSGTTVAEQLSALKHTYNPLAKIAFPEAHIGDPDAYKTAAAIFPKLAEFRSIAERAIRARSYTSSEEEIEISAAGKTYILGRPWRSGEIADLYLSGKELVKIARASEDEDLMQAEQQNLKKLRSFIASRNSASSWLRTFPEIHQSFRVKQADLRRANVLGDEPYYLSAEEIVAKMGRVDARTIAWMAKRILGLLEWTSHAGIVHGAITPDHLLFFPDNTNEQKRDARKHSVYLVDWCYSVPTGQRLKAYNAPYGVFYPPEVMAKQPVSVQTDLYMATKSLIYLAGGDVGRNRFPSDFPPAIANHLHKCLADIPENRVRDASQYYSIFERLLTVEFGPSKWHDFFVPNILKEDSNGFR
jgi:hypothetical protein